ncbi:hypothetical protein ACFV4P_25725 [Kitasatospora sp. NPDC059795]|uniref:hypothetical protein n=1 Tax=Kitasatospora sp. NPDC059795 TaxID=3346949 RepID=UPI00365668B7
MPQATQRIEPGTGLIPAPRTAPDGATAATPREEPQPEGWRAALARGFAVARSMRSLRPVAARGQQSYGEADGQ